MTDSKIQLFASLIGNVNKTDIATCASEAVSASLPEFGNVLSSAGANRMNLSKQSDDTVAFPQVATNRNQQQMVRKAGTTATISQGAKAKIEQKMEKAKLRAEELPGNIDEVMTQVNTAIAEEICTQLDITPQQLDDALQELGLAITDLLEPSNLAKLFLHFKPEMNMADVLTDADFMNLSDTVKAVATETLESVGIEPEKFDYILKNVEQKRPELLMPPIEAEEQPTITIDRKIQTSEPEQYTEVVATEEVESEDAQVQQVMTQTTEEVKTQDETIVIEDATKEAKPEAQVVQVEVVRTTEQEEQRVNPNEIPIVSDEEEVEEAPQILQNAEQDASSEKEEEGAESPFDRLLKNMEKKETQFEHKPIERPQAEATTTRVQTQTIVTPEGNTLTEQSVRVVDLQNLVTEVTNYIRMQAPVNQISSIEMQLNPANLGKVFVEVISNQGEITARIATQTEAAKEAMETNLVQLKDNLESQGIKVNAVEVTVESHSFEENLQEDGSKEQQQLAKEMQKQHRRMNLNLNEMTLEDLEGLMSEEDMVVAKIMKDNGNTMNIGV